MVFASAETFAEEPQEEKHIRHLQLRELCWESFGEKSTLQMHS
jgi:hypothetical protein